MTPIQFFMTASKTMSTNGLRTNYNPPFAGILQILLATGYSFLSSILELIDNSISKDAINIHTLLFNEPDRICVMDDGVGMTLTQLCDAFVIADIKHDRIQTDIGKFHIGMKSAIMNMGTAIIILSKTEGGNIAGLWADIEIMKEKNTYNPTEINPSVNVDWATKHGIKESLFTLFARQESGTLVHVRNLLQKSALPYDSAKIQLEKGIAISYSNLRPDLKIWIGNCVPGDNYAGKLVECKEVPLVDLFYSEDNTDSDNLEFPPYETVLLVYEPEAKHNPYHIIEMNKTKRTISTNNRTHGTFEKPIYYEYTTLAKFARTNSNIRQIGLLPKTKLIGTVHVRVVQAKEHVYKAEKDKVYGFLEGDRKGFYFKRGVRTVGVAKRIGKKLHDRTTNAAERQRMLVEFTSTLDDIVGSKFNKQMDDQALPSQELTDALFSIYKQVTGPWVAETEKREKKDDKSVTSDHSVAVMLKPKSGKQIPSSVDTPANEICEDTINSDNDTEQSVPVLTELANTVPAMIISMFRGSVDVVKPIVESAHLVAEPEQAVAEPEQAVAEPEQAVAEPEQAVAEPEQTVAEPAQAVAEPEQEEAEPEQEAVEPEQEEAEPEQEAVEPEQEEAKPEQEAVEPEQEEAKPEQEAVEPEQEEAESAQTIVVPVQTVIVPVQAVAVSKETMIEQEEVELSGSESIQGETESVLPEPVKQLFTVETKPSGTALISVNPKVFIKVSDSTMTLLDWLNTLTLEQVTVLSSIL